MDHVAGLGDANGAQYYAAEQPYGSDQLYGVEPPAYSETSGKLIRFNVDKCVDHV